MDTKENMIDCYAQALQYIINLGFDYDGFHEKEDLQELIDELVDIARKGLQLKRPHHTVGGKIYEYIGNKSIEVEEKNYYEADKLWLATMLQIKENKEKKNE